MSAIIKNLADLPLGSQVFVETNIFNLYYKQKSLSCHRLIENLVAGKVSAYVNTQIVSELIHNLMLAEAVQKGYIQRANAKLLKEWLRNHRDQADTLVNYQQYAEDLLKHARLKVLPMNRELLMETKLERAVYGMMTRDSLRLGNMNRSKPVLTHIVSYVDDFEHIDGITVWKPMDVS